MTNLKPFTINPNTCSQCAAGPLATVYAPNQDQANAGAGLCPKCAGVGEAAAAPKQPKPITKMNKAELLAEATRLGLTADESMTNAQLLDLIAAASEA